MKKSCTYCGRIHDAKELCEKKPKPRKKYNDNNAFRNTMLWQSTREYIKERDRYLCQACLRDAEGTIVRYNSDGLEVHHIQPLYSHYELRIEGTNLITLCGYHHQQADIGRLKSGWLQRVADFQESPGV